MKQRKLIETGLLFLFVLMFGTCAYLYARPSVTVENTFATGIVNIGLNTYQINKNGEEEAWVDNPYVLPGSEVSNIKRITNLNTDSCYVRAKVAFLDTDTVNLANLQGISDDWVLKDDGYYYYKPVLPGEESVDLFTSISIPEYVGDENEGLTFSLSVQVEAMQSQNVTPDYESDTPWGEVVILKANTDGKNTMTSVETFKVFSVTYQGEAGNIATNEQDFFANLPALYPGDVYSDSLELKNDSGQNINMYFRSEVPESEDDLLQKMQIKISVKNVDGSVKELYNGPIQTDAYAEDTAIITLPAGTSGSLLFTVTMPAELNNDYTLMHKSVLWTFSTEVIPEHVDPDTGDTSLMFLYMAGMALSAAGIIFILAGKRRRNGKADPQ